MQLLQFMQFYMYFLVAGTLAVTGWYFITRGREEILPDGRVVRKGKVFMGWYFYWTKTKGKCNVYFIGEELQKLHKQYLVEFPNDPYGFFIQDNVFIVNKPFTDNDVKEMQKHIEKIETALDVKVLLKNQQMLSFYKEYDKYVWPWWLRDPMAVCATCFASVYGTIFYWGVVLVCGENLFAWTVNVLLAKILFWISFTFSLAVLNTALAKKFN